ncbi:MAG: single-stranded DNA-binding protein [Ruminococcus sp.]|nr:single-stranded DNA-binding protein [Ruminococcus sp.]
MALNKAILMGRITHDLEIKTTPSGSSVLSFTLAVDRFSKSEEKQTDFINCVAWNKTAEFIGRYFGKGRMIAVTGNLHSRTYEDKNGTKHYVTEVYVESADFTGEPKMAQGWADSAYSAQNNAGAASYTPQTNAPQNGAQSATEGLDNFDLFGDVDEVPF